MAAQKHQTLRFSDQVSISTFNTPSQHQLHRPRTMAKQVTVLPHKDVTDDMMVKAASLFSNNYGIWGKEGYGKPGSRVRMSGPRLRAQCLPEGSDGTYVQVTIDGVMAGHAFVCRWNYQSRNVLWVTQLVVHSEYRELGIASLLLASCLDINDEVFGIMSSHPAACKALARAFGRGASIAQISTDFAKKHAAGVLADSPVQYIRDAELCGSVFDAEDSTGMVIGVNSKFYVDHGEPLEALESLQEEGSWPLGDLPEGHEFMLLFERPQRIRSSSSCSSSNV